MVPKDVSVEQAHRLCDELEHDIEIRLSYTSVTIHVTGSVSSVLFLLTSASAPGEIR